MLTRDFEAALASWTELHDGPMLDRALEYARDRRVLSVSVRGDQVSASVRGEHNYEVTLRYEAKGSVDSTCTCPAFYKLDTCKHALAVALSLTPKTMPHIPAPFSARASAGTTMPRLELYLGRRLPRSDSPWHSLEQVCRRLPTVAAILDEAVPALNETLATLRDWSPPPAPVPGTGYAALYDRLADFYRSAAPRMEISDALPGPLDARHPGFTFTLDASRGQLLATENMGLGGSSTGLSVMVSHATSPGGASPPGRVPWGPSNDAWLVFGLRALLIALHEQKEPAALALASRLGEPEWALVLQTLTKASAKSTKDADWAFYLERALHGTLTLGVETIAFGKRGEKRMRGTFDALLDAENATEIEKQIARAALAGGNVREVSLDPRSAHGHELLRLLSDHPRVSFVESRPKGADAIRRRVRIVAERVSMKFESADDGSVSPTFVAADRELSEEALDGAANGFGGGIEEDPVPVGEAEIEVQSYSVPRALRPWILAHEAGRSLRFPREAINALVEKTGTLVSAKHAEFPRSALGAELASDTTLALRIEWRPDGTAAVEALVSVHPRAPLVAPGQGPALYTFLEPDGSRAFVERDIKREQDIVDAARARLPITLMWHDNLGGTESVDEALALARYIGENPQGLRIEAREGKAPKAVPWNDVVSRLTVRRAGSWLFVDGEISHDGAKVTLGEVLDAIRMAKRYVNAGDGRFFEITEEVQKKLLPMAAAIDLAAVRGEPDRIHAVFGSVIAAAAVSFQDQRGFDLAALASRISTRGTSTKEPRLEQGTLRDYQTEGAAFMLDLATWAPGVILADDMGLGKTVQTAAVLTERSAGGPALVVAPASVVSNWERELHRFAPSLKVRSWHEDGPDAHVELGPGDVLVTSYGLLQRRADALDKLRLGTLVLDEAHYVKNITARRTDAVRGLTRDFTIALTGTPLENHLGELFSIIDVVLPGVFGTEQAFRERFRRPIETLGDTRKLAALGALLQPFMLRRTRGDVLSELPPREEVVELIDASAPEQKRYRALREACALSFSKNKREKQTNAQLKIALLSALMRLRQLSCDVRLVDPAYDGPNTKVERIVDLVGQITAERGRVLVFSQFVQFLKRIERGLAQAGMRTLMLTGETETTSRQRVVDAFQGGECDILCVSLMAGGTGLNLTRANYVIHADPWWNPAAEEQATSRAHRMGQTEPVTVYRLITRGTIEEAVLAMHATKRGLAEAVLSGKSTPKQMTEADLLSLLSYGATAE